MRSNRWSRGNRQQKLVGLVLAIICALPSCVASLAVFGQNQNKEKILKKFKILQNSKYLDRGIGKNLQNRACSRPTG